MTTTKTTCRHANTIDLLDGARVCTSCEAVIGGEDAFFSALLAEMARDPQTAALADAIIAGTEA